MESPFKFNRAGDVVMEEAPPLSEPSKLQSSKSAFSELTSCNASSSKERPAKPPADECFFPNIRRHMLGRLLPSDEPIRAVCPVCWDGMNVANVQGSDDKNRECVVVACGHVTCKRCFDELERNRGDGDLTCPTCSLKLQCEACRRPLIPRLAPTGDQDPQTVMDAVPLTESEAEEGTKCSEVLCPPCGGRRGWIQRILSGEYPQELLGLNEGFIVFVYYTLDWLEKEEHVPDDFEYAIVKVFMQVIHDEFESVMGARSSRWSDDIFELEPGFVCFVYTLTDYICGKTRSPVIDYGTVVLAFVNLLETNFSLMSKIRDDCVDQFASNQPRGWWSGI